MRASFIQIEFIRPKRGYRSAETSSSRCLEGVRRENFKSWRKEMKKRTEGSVKGEREAQKKKALTWQERNPAPVFIPTANQWVVIYWKILPLSKRGNFKKWKNVFQSKKLSALNHRFRSSDFVENESIIRSLQWIIWNEFASAVRKAKYTYLTKYASRIDT